MVPESSPGSYLSTQRVSAATIAIIVAAHAGVLALLASIDVLPLPTPLSTLMVQLVAAAPAAEVSPPRATPPARRVENKPQVRPKPVPATPVSEQLAARSDAPGATAEAAPTRDVPAPASAASTASSATATVVATPRFDADYLANPAPTYPSLSRKMREEGQVVLRVLVDASGRPSRIEIKRSSAWPRLDQAAQDAVARWKFVPAKRGDEAVDAWVLVPIVFNLKS